MTGIKQCREEAFRHCFYKLRAFAKRVTGHGMNRNNTLFLDNRIHGQEREDSKKLIFT